MSSSIHIGSHRVYALGYQRIPIIPRREMIRSRSAWKLPKATRALSSRRLSLGDHRGSHLSESRARHHYLGLDGIKFFEPDFVEKVIIGESEFPGYPFKVNVVMRKPSADALHEGSMFQRAVYDYRARAGMKVFFMELESDGAKKINFCFLFKDDFRNKETIKGFIKDLEWYPQIKKEIKKLKLLSDE